MNPPWLDHAEEVGSGGCRGARTGCAGRGPGSRRPRPGSTWRCRQRPWLSLSFIHRGPCSTAVRGILLPAGAGSKQTDRVPQGPVISSGSGNARRRGCRSVGAREQCCAARGRVARHLAWAGSESWCAGDATAAVVGSAGSVGMLQTGFEQWPRDAPKPAAPLEHRCGSHDDRGRGREGQAAQVAPTPWCAAIGRAVVRSTAHSWAMEPRPWAPAIEKA